MALQDGHKGVCRLEKPENDHTVMGPDPEAEQGMTEILDDLEDPAKDQEQADGEVCIPVMEKECDPIH